MKKISAIVVALIIVVSSIVPVFAGPGVIGPIVPSPPLPRGHTRPIIVQLVEPSAYDALTLML